MMTQRQSNHLLSFMWFLTPQIIMFMKKLYDHKPMLYFYINHDYMYYFEKIYTITAIIIHFFVKLYDHSYCTL